MFLNSRESFKEYLKKTKKPFMANFYKLVRINSNILITKDKKPIGDKWSFDAENRKKIPKDIPIPKFPTIKLSNHSKELLPFIKENFSSHPGNIGAAARAMKNMGMTQLRLVNCVNHRDTQAYNRSSGAEDILYQATCHKTLADAVQDCHHVIATSGRQRTNQHPPTLCARKLPDYLSRIQKQSIIALVFGNEQNGLDNQAIQQSHCQISVPTNPKFKSLNVASCVQLICFLCSAY